MCAYVRVCVRRGFSLRAAAQYVPNESPRGWQVVHACRFGVDRSEGKDTLASLPNLICSYGLGYCRWELGGGEKFGMRVYRKGGQQPASWMVVIARIGRRA